MWGARVNGTLVLVFIGLAMSLGPSGGFRKESHDYALACDCAWLDTALTVSVA